MFVIPFLILWTLSGSRGEISIRKCEEPKDPYQTPDHYCSNFNEVCVKSSDPVCENFLNICKQCPPNNYSTILFFDMQIIKSQINKIMKDRTEKSYGMIISIIIINIIILAVIIIRYSIKLNRIYKEKFAQHNRNSSYLPLTSEPLENTTNHVDELSDMKFQLERIIDQKYNILTEKIDKLFNPSSVNQTFLITFKIKDLNKKIELDINPSDNIVQIKKLIYSKLSKDIHYYKKYDFCKRMRLKYNGNILDDNRCLLPYITDRNIAVDCEIDHSIDADRHVIIELEGNNNFLRVLQVPLTNTIADLKIVMFESIKSFDYFFVKERNIIKDKVQIEQCEILKEDLAIGDCEITDGNLVKIIKRRFGKLRIISIFEEDESLVVEYSNLKSVSSLATEAANKFNSNPENFNLFINNICLNKDKNIFEYNIDEKSSIKYCCLMKLDKKLEIGEFIDRGCFSELRKGKIKSSGKDTLIIKYNFSTLPKQIKELLPKGLIKYQRLKSNPRFVQVKGIYEDDESLYISTEYLSEGTLTTFLNKKPEITEDIIVRWSKQILEGIKTFHDNGIVYRYFKKYNFLMGENKEIKFFTFFLSDYLSETKTPKEMLDIFISSKIPLVYLSPEIKELKPFDQSTDVWSFGVLLVDIINGTTENINGGEIEEFIRNEKIKEKLPNWLSEEMKYLIESCLRISPNKRPTIDQLLLQIEQL